MTDLQIQKVRVGSFLSYNEWLGIVIDINTTQYRILWIHNKEAASISRHRRFDLIECFSLLSA